jgi:hypothetical protein
MSQHPPANNALPIAIFYEVVPEDAQEADPGELQAVADTTVEALRKEGYTVNPVSTGAKGLDSLFQIVLASIPLIPVAAQYKEEITAVVQSVEPLIERIDALHKARMAKQAAQQEQSRASLEMRYGNNYDILKLDTADKEVLYTTIEKFIENSQHTRAQRQPRVVEQDTLSLTIREHVPPRPRRRKY